MYKAEAFRDTRIDTKLKINIVMKPSMPVLGAITWTSHPHDGVKMASSLGLLTTLTLPPASLATRLSIPGPTSACCSLHYHLFIIIIISIIIIMNIIVMIMIIIIVVIMIVTMIIIVIIMPIIITSMNRFQASGQMRGGPKAKIQMCMWVWDRALQRLHEGDHTSSSPTRTLPEQASKAV